MKLVTADMLQGLEHINGIDEKAQNILLREVDEVIEDLVEDLIQNEMLGELKKDNSGGYGSKSSYLGECIDGFWVSHVVGGIEDTFDCLEEKGLVSEEVFEGLDDEENLLTDMQENFSRMMKSQLVKAGVGQEIVDSLDD